MTELFLLVLTGAFAGTIGGLFGVGGGIVIVPVLYAVFLYGGADPTVAMKTAVGTSLATIIVTSIRSLRAHHKRGAVDFSVLKTWGPFIAGGAVLGALAARVISGEALLIVFALGALGMGAQRLLGKKGGGKAIHLQPSAERGLAVGTGFFSALMGIGGGVIGVVLLTLAGRPMHQAVGTASGFGLAIAVPGALGFLAIGLGQAGIAGAIGYVHAFAFLAIALGTLIFAPVGAALAHRLPAPRLSAFFGVYLLITGVVLLREAVVSLS
ncbi:MAG: sulfite exporter TauE/SafE family protein [Pseudomonadota bacterium]